MSGCWGFLKIAYNVLQLPEGCDFGAIHCQPSINFDRSTKLDLTTEPPLLGRCCYKLLFYHPFSLTRFLITEYPLLVNVPFSLISLFSSRSMNSLSFILEFSLSGIN